MAFKLGGVRPQAHQLLGDVAAVRQQGRLLRQALRVDAGAMQQIGQFLAQTLEECGHGSGADLFHARHQPVDVLAALAHLLSRGSALALAETG